MPVIDKSRIGRSEIDLVTLLFVRYLVALRLEEELDVVCIGGDLSREIAEVNDAVRQSELDRIVFKINALTALVFDQSQIRKVRASVFVEPYPDLRSADVGRVDFEIAA